MNNADQPAYPVLLHEEEALPGGMEPNGLTKREEIASRLLAGLFANPSLVADLRDAEGAEYVAELIEAADEAAIGLLEHFRKYPAKELN